MYNKQRMIQEKSSGNVKGLKAILPSHQIQQSKPCFEVNTLTVRNFVLRNSYPFILCTRDT